VWGHYPLLYYTLEYLCTLEEAASVMEWQLSRPYWTCTREIGQPCYRSIDGRFEVRNTWSVDKVREPNWLLVDLVTGHSYRFFVRLQVEQKMEALLAQAGSADAGTGQHD